MIAAEDMALLPGPVTVALFLGYEEPAVATAAAGTRLRLNFGCLLGCALL